MKAPHIDGRLERQASDVAARSRKTCDKAAANRVVCHGEHDRDLLCREECGSRRDNDIPFQLDELATLAPLRQALSYGRLSCGGLIFGFVLKACTFRLLPHRKPIFVNQLEAAFEQLEPELAVGFRPNVVAGFWKAHKGLASLACHPGESGTAPHGFLANSALALTD